MNEHKAEPDWTDWESEGLPETDSQPPGVDADTAVEGSFPARDEPLAVEDWGTTAREERIGESLEQRLAREEPEAWEAEDPAAALEDSAAPDSAADGIVGSPRGASAEEEAMHVIEP